MSIDEVAHRAERGAADGVAARADLDAAVEALDVVFRCADGRLARQVTHEEFSLVVLHPEMRKTDREVWIESLADYELIEWELRDERLDLVDGTAAHHRRAWRVSRSDGVRQSGEILVTDHWIRGVDAWRVWQRTITPLG